MLRRGPYDQGGWIVSEDSSGTGSPRPRRSLTFRILVGMAAGMATGVVLNLLLESVAQGGGLLEDAIRNGLVDGAFYIGGAIFMASLKLLVVPLVFVSLVCGTAALDDIGRLGRIGGKTMGLYLLTTAIAVTLALFFASLLQPGRGLDLPTGLEFAAGEAPRRW
jgi:Na+/H+-dicarboxylate symporter